MKKGQKKDNAKKAYSMRFNPETIKTIDMIAKATKSNREAYIENLIEEHLKSLEK